MQGESAALRRLVCRLRGHRWDVRSLACTRCRRTQLEIEMGELDPVVERRVSDSYWRGVEAGRKIDRKRAYRLGYMRGGRDVFSKVEEVFGRG